MITVQSRRRFLTNLAFTGAAGLVAARAAGLGGGRRSLAAEPPPEITTIRFEKDPVTCIAPQVAHELLRAEGFTEIQFIELTDADVDSDPLAPIGGMLARGEVDFARDYAATHILAMEAGIPVTLLAGLHTACFQVFAKNDIRRIEDLKGRTVGTEFGDENLVRIVVSLVGLNPASDIRWPTTESPAPLKLFVQGKIDAFLASPPVVQEVHARKIGHVIVDAMVDPPWSDYFCCYLATRSEFVQRYPIATKRAMRAILKAADLCVSEPKRIAQLLVDQGYATRYDYALQSLADVRYVWRDYDVDDTLPFYAVRMYEAGMIKSSPQQLLAKHTDWRFLNELKRELKT
jgi:NitT/TauT family transport system substrate-binding protein